MPKIDCCNEPKIRLQENFQRICENCGSVVEDNQLTVAAHDAGDILPHHVVKFDELTPKELKVWRSISEVGSALMLPDRIMKNAMSRFIIMQAEDHVGYGKKGCACALLCLYYICRENASPIEISQLVKVSNVSLAEFRAVFKRINWSRHGNVAQQNTASVTPNTVLSNLNPQMTENNNRPLLHLAIESFLPKCIHEFIGLEQQDASISQHCKSLIKIIRFNLLLEGKSPLPMAIGISYIALSASRRKMILKSELWIVSESLGATKTTVAQHVKLIEDTLISLGKIFPFFSDLCRSNLYGLLPSVILHLDSLVQKQVDTDGGVQNELSQCPNSSAKSQLCDSSASPLNAATIPQSSQIPSATKSQYSHFTLPNESQSLPLQRTNVDKLLFAPPSFKKGVKKGIIVQKRIGKARERMKFAEHGISCEVEVDAQDQVVHQLLQQGCREEDIASYKLEKMVK